MSNEETSARILAAAAELQLVDNVFAGVEQSIMIAAPINYSVADLQKRIAENKIDLNQTEEIWFEELSLWRESLVERDQEFSALDLRLFCANAQPPFDNSVYRALAGFYRKMNPTIQVLSKFDYVVTQLFSHELDNNRRELRFESEKMVDEIHQLNPSSINEQPHSKPAKSQIGKSINALSKLCVQAKGYKTLRNWVEDEFFDCSREVKRSLTETFFVPEVTAAVIICNLVIGNQFAFLCETDAAALAEPSGSFAANGKRQDIISSSLNSSFQTLLYSTLEEDFAETQMRNKLSNLFSSIGDKEMKENVLDAQPSQSEGDIDTGENILGGEKTLQPDETTESVDTSDESKSFSTLTTSEILSSKMHSEDLTEISKNTDPIPHESEPQVKAPSKIETGNQALTSDSQNVQPQAKKVEVILNELSRSNPDREVIRNYLQKSAVQQIRELRFEVFLDVEQDLKNRNLHQALTLIIQAEDTMNEVMSAEGDLLPKLQEEIVLLNEKIQIACNNLRRSMSEATSMRGDDKPRQKVFETLLYATNTLIETQLRLNSVITRRQNKEKIESEENTSPVTDQPSKLADSSPNKIRDYSSVHSVSSETDVVKRQPNKWLMIAASSVVLLGFAWFIFNSTIASEPVESPDVQTLVPASLNGGANLIKAKVNKNTLFGYVGEEWNSQTLEQKEKSLKLLLEDGRKYSYNKVLLINQNGKIVSNASDAGITVF